MVMRQRFRIFPILACVVLLLSCARGNHAYDSSCEYAEFFDVKGDELIVYSPYSGSTQKFDISKPMERIICMSSTQVAALTEIGADSLIVGVSGLKYLANPSLLNRGCPDVGYELSLNYEKILELKPDVLITYSVSMDEPQHVTKLRTLGVPVLVIYEHYEKHPLGKAEYVRLCGALTGRQKQADEWFAGVKDRYCTLADSVKASGKGSLKVLMNVPYGEAWFVPGSENYMSRLVEDAGGTVLGTKVGRASSVMSLEQAYDLSQSADIWMHVEGNNTREELSATHQLFPKFGPLAKGLPIYNNTLRMNSEGGNDFWESGAVRPDLILEDLVRIFSSGSGELHYYFEVR